MRCGVDAPEAEGKIEPAAPFRRGGRRSGPEVRKPVKGCATRPNL